LPIWSCADFEAELKEFNGERDHIHLLVTDPPKVRFSELVNSLKGVSSRRLKAGIPGPLDVLEHPQEQGTSLVPELFSPDP